MTPMLILLLREGVLGVKKQSLVTLLTGALMLVGLPSNALSARQQFDLCRSVMENRPYNPAIDGPYSKPTNSIGYGAYPPPGMNRIWIDFNCSEIPGIYDPF